MSEKKFSLLHFLVKTFFEADRKRLAFVQNYEDLSKVLRYDLDEFEKTKNGFNTQVAIIQAEVKEAEDGIRMLAEDPQMESEILSFTAFRDHFKPFLEEAQKKLEMLQTSLDKIKNKAAKCNQVYGLPASCKPGDLLKLQDSFIETVRKHVTELTRQETKIKKKEEYEKKLKARQDAAGKPEKGHQNLNTNPKQPRTTVIPSGIERNTDRILVQPDQGGIESSPEVSSSGMSIKRPSPFRQLRPVVRPTAFGGAAGVNMPMISPQVSQTPGSRPQPNNRRRVAIGDQYKKKDGSGARPSEGTEGRLTGVTKFQRETVNLSNMILLSAISYDGDQEQREEACRKVQAKNTERY